MALPTLNELSTVLSNNDATMVFDVIAAANVTENINFFKGYVPGDGGFMFSHPPPEMQAISAAMTYREHSGASYAWAVRTAQTILRHGLEIYANEISRMPNDELRLRYLRESLPFKLKAAENERDDWERRINSINPNTDNDTMERLSLRLAEANDRVNDLRSQLAIMA